MTDTSKHVGFEGATWKGRAPWTGRAIALSARPVLALPCYGLILLIALVWQPASHFGSDPGLLSLYLVLSAIVAAVHLAFQRDRNWMRIDTLFLLAFLIVHFQWPAMILLSEIVPTDTRIVSLIEQYATFGTWLATIGLTGWAIGYAVPRTKPVERVQVVGNLAPAVVIQGILLAAFVILAGRDYLTGQHYTEVRDGVWATISGPAAYIGTVLPATSGALMLAALYNHVIAHRTGHPRPLSALFMAPPILLAMAYALLFLIAAERGEVIRIVSAGLIALCCTLRPVRLPTFILMFFAGSLLMALIGYGRSTGFSDLDQFFEGFTFWNATVNLANSAVTLYLGIEIVAERGDCFWGQLWISNLLSLVPMAQSAFINISSVPFYELNGAYLITYYVFGDNPNTGYGTSLAIDIYMNFGAAGVVFLMMAYGHLCRTFQIFLSARYGFYRFLAAGMFAGLVIYISRSSLLTQLQPVVWAYLFAVLMLKLRNIPIAGRRQSGSLSDQRR